MKARKRPRLSGKTMRHDNVKLVRTLRMADNALSQLVSSRLRWKRSAIAALSIALLEAFIIGGLLW